MIFSVAGEAATVPENLAPVGVAVGVADGGVAVPVRPRLMASKSGIPFSGVPVGVPFTGVISGVIGMSLSAYEVSPVPARLSPRPRNAPVSCLVGWGGVGLLSPSWIQLCCWVQKQLTKLQIQSCGWVQKAVCIEGIADFHEI